MEKYGLLGRKLGHSFSPQIHRLLADYEYLLYEKEPEEVASFLETTDLAGMNVTIPYKETVLPFCRVLSDTAQKIGSVNTLLKKDGAWEGHNTDYDGFDFLLRRAGLDPKGKKVLVLGSGGSSKTARAVLYDRGAAQIVVISRTGADNYQNLDRHADANLIVNTTPVGMFPNCGAAAVSLSDFPACEGVIDIIYNPSKTKLLLDAEERGIPFMNGLPMLVAQAKKAAELFLGQTIDDQVIPEIVHKIECQTKNIALIGMPGCGKTAVGKTLSRLTGRTLIELDELIPQKAGKSIARLFAEDGEEVFRRVETDILAEHAKKSGVILSTGGGVVTEPRNLPLLRQNSVILFLNRPIADLPTAGRPLSESRGFEQLAKERLPLYRAWCDHEISCGDGVEKTAHAICRLCDLEVRK